MKVYNSELELIENKQKESEVSNILDTEISFATVQQPFVYPYQKRLSISSRMPCRFLVQEWSTHSNDIA